MVDWISSNLDGEGAALCSVVCCEMVERDGCSWRLVRHLSFSKHSKKNSDVEFNHDTCTSTRTEHDEL